MSASVSENIILVSQTFSHARTWSMCVCHIVRNSARKLHHYHIVIVIVIVIRVARSLAWLFFLSKCDDYSNYYRSIWTEKIILGSNILALLYRELSDPTLLWFSWPINRQISTCTDFVDQLCVNAALSSVHIYLRLPPVSYTHLTLPTKRIV